MHMQVSDTNNVTLKLLKKKYNVTKMDDVITLLLTTYEKDIYKKGTKIASLRRDMEKSFNRDIEAMFNEVDE